MPSKLSGLSEPSNESTRMINANTWNPAITLARMQSRMARFDCACLGMSGVLDEFALQSRVQGANRKPDGLPAIDSAVSSLRRAWRRVLQLNPTPADQEVAALLNACAQWRTNMAGQPDIVGRRGTAVDRLYWKVAWCYSTSAYAFRALNAVVTTPNTAVPMTGFSHFIAGNPYDFPNSGYTQTYFQQPLLRGDTRGPIAIATANGFGPRSTNPGTYAPWFNGAAMGCTVSATMDEVTATDAGTFAHAMHEATDHGPLPSWLTAAYLRNNVPGGSALDARIRGFVYELGNLGNVPATRLSDVDEGVEHIFLKIPAACITRWWVTVATGHTVGPFPFPAAPLAPAAVFYSDTRRSLAYAPRAAARRPLRRPYAPPPRAVNP